MSDGTCPGLRRISRDWAVNFGVAMIGMVLREVQAILSPATVPLRLALAPAAIIVVATRP